VTHQPVRNAIRSRRSIRAFLPDPVPPGAVCELIADAQWSPSGGNLQPWGVHVVMGEARDAFVAAMDKRLFADPFADESNLAVYPPDLPEPWRTRRFQVGEDMYAAIAISRENKSARLAHLARNFEFFGAPVGVFVTLNTIMGPAQYAHAGMFLQTLCLLAQERGLATCMQEAWNRRAKTVAELLRFTPDERLYCGVALGVPDHDHPINQFDRERASLNEVARIHVKASDIAL
jgi:nitroreductase